VLFTDGWERADEHFARSVERNADSGKFAWAVFGKSEYTALLARRGRPEDQVRVGELVRDCLVGATKMG
jgi:hypothetical protein